jgi:sugar phosphate isomerase/epimerase
VALDTEFLALHNQLEDTFTTPWLWQSNLVRHVHIKDHAGRLVAGTGRRYLHPGEGQIDFHRFVQQLKAVRFDGTLSLEARAIDHNGQVEIAHIQKSLHFMRSLIAEGESEP